MRRDLVYRLVAIVGRPVFWIVSRPVVLHPERAAGAGGFLLAANHLSPYDVPCLMYTTRRRIDWVSIVELWGVPFVGRLFRALNAMPLDRSRPDSDTVRTIVDRLRRGRVVGIFPEGRVQTGDRSVLAGGRFRKGIGRMARMAGVPIVPCVIRDSSNFRGAAPWLPLRRTRFAVAYGEPIRVDEGGDRRSAAAAAEEAWLRAVRRLDEELKPHIRW